MDTEQDFKLREYQNDIISFIITSFTADIGAAIESPTGSGKTVMGLSAAVKYAAENNKRILYLTRTNSQQEQVFYVSSFLYTLFTELFDRAFQVNMYIFI